MKLRLPGFGTPTSSPASLPKARPLGASRHEAASVSPQQHSLNRLQPNRAGQRASSAISPGALAPRAALPLSTPFAAAAESKPPFSAARPATKLPEAVLHEAVQKAALADEVYKDYPGEEGKCSVPGWKDISRDEQQLAKYGLSPQDLKADNANGFRSRLYVPEEGSPHAGMAPQLVFRGTKTRTDVLADLRQGMGLRTDHFDQAAKVGRKLAESGNLDVQLVGHSLGGGLASAAALVSGHSATTFDAAGLNNDQRRRMSEDGAHLHPGVEVTAFHMKSELLTSVQRNSSLPEAFGTSVSVPHASGESKTGLLGRAQAHKMPSMIAALKQAEAHAAESGEVSLHARQRSKSVPKFGHLGMEAKQVVEMMRTDPQLKSRLNNEMLFVNEFARQEKAGISRAKMKFDGVDNAATLMKDFSTLVPENALPEVKKERLAALVSKASELHIELLFN
jgi:hypothetical protein